MVIITMLKKVLLWMLTKSSMVIMLNIILSLGLVTNIRLIKTCINYRTIRNRLGRFRNTRNWHHLENVLIHRTSQ